MAIQPPSAAGFYRRLTIVPLAALGGWRCANFLNSKSSAPDRRRLGVVFTAIDPAAAPPGAEYEAGAYLLIAALL